MILVRFSPLLLLLLVSATSASAAAVSLFFERDSYQFYVSESAPINAKVGTVQATSSSSWPVRYELHGDPNKTFRLDSATGVLSLSNALDYETVSLYKLTIEARSSSTVASSFSEITIHVLNTNDNPPEINLMFYPSVSFEGNVIKYDSNVYSTPLATINIKDLDESTANLTLALNDTKNFQLQFVRQSRNGFLAESIYILSTKNNAQLTENDDYYYYLSLNACDNDRPALWTNRTYEFRLQPNENLCGFNQTNFIISIRENAPNRTLVSPRLTNAFCENVFYSIDDPKNFFVHPDTGELYTSTSFDREEQSIYRVTLRATDRYRKIIRAQLTIRVVDEYGHVPFLIQKKLKIDRQKFTSVDLYNSTYCHYQTMIYNYFQLLSNCTLIRLASPTQGKYLFHIQLNQKYDYEDTFLLELTDDDNAALLFTLVDSQWMVIVPILLGIVSILLLIICAAMVIRARRYKRFHQQQQHHHNQKPSPSLSNSEESVHNKYEAISTLSKLQVHDDHELSPSPISTAIYLVQKSAASSPTRDDEGYSGSSDVSDNPLSTETTIITGNHLVEQYHVHDFRTRRTLSPSSEDVPQQRTSISCVSPDVSLV